jgi:hypothetical protein
MASTTSAASAAMAAGTGTATATGPRCGASAPRTTAAGCSANGCRQHRRRRENHNFAEHGGTPVIHLPYLLALASHVNPPIAAICRRVMPKEARVTNSVQARRGRNDVSVV